MTVTSRQSYLCVSVLMLLSVSASAFTAPSAPKLPTTMLSRKGTSGAEENPYEQLSNAAVSQFQQNIAPPQANPALPTNLPMPALPPLEKKKEAVGDFEVVDLNKRAEEKKQAEALKAQQEAVRAGLPPLPGAAPAVAASPAQAGAPQESLSPTVTIDMARDAAYQATLRQAFPMTPKQIRGLHRAYDDSQAAAAAAPRTPPKPTSSSLGVSLQPGATPPVIRLSQGFVSSLVFIDSTGGPWPIEAYDLGNPKAFDIQWDKKSNTLMVQAKTPYTYGNLAVTLHQLSTPVMITLIPGQPVVDYRVDLRVQGLGPNARPMPLGSGMPADANPILFGVLDGVAPSGSTRLQLEGGAGQAWQLGNNIYLRTRLTVLSPGWIATMRSPDGTNAYQLPVTPLVLASHNGKAVRFKIKGV